MVELDKILASFCAYDFDGYVKTFKNYETVRQGVKK